jgi:hypothetical protein
MAPSVGLSGFPDIQWTLDEMIAEGDKVAARFTMWGTHQGAFFGVPPSGKKIEVKAMNFYLYWVWKWLVESHMKSRKSRRNFRRSLIKRKDVMSHWSERSDTRFTKRRRMLTLLLRPENRDHT